MVNVQVRRAALLARQGKLDEGRALLKACLAQSGRKALPEPAPRCNCCGNNKQYQAAYDVLNEALAANPDRPGLPV
jgi:hypothetical protein